MTTIFVADTVGDSLATIQQALRDAGWQVISGADVSEAADSGADAAVLAADAVGLATAQGYFQTLRRAMPIVLLAYLDRSGWDRTFEAEEAFNVDALLDAPVNAHALVARLKGILDARRDARQGPAGIEMNELIDRAVANEEAAAAFYRRAAESVVSEETRDALQALMRDEQSHKQLLEEFRSGKREMPTTKAAPANIVETFGTPDFHDRMSPADAFLLAANKERLAVEMYENWARLYPDGPQRDMLLGLAEVERVHKAKVESLFANAAFPESW